MIIADSDVLIDAPRGREPGKSRVALDLQTGRLATTSINDFELRSDARTPREQVKVDALLSALTVVPFDEAAADAAAAIRREPDGAGAGLAMADYLIAGACLSRSAVLLTRNRAHFQRMPGLALVGRWEADAPPR